MAGLPLEQAVQVHVSKSSVNDAGLAFDSHELPDPGLNAEIFALVKSRGIEYVTIEYYKDWKKLVETLKTYRLGLGIGDA